MKFFTNFFNLNNRRQNFVDVLYLLIKHIFRTKNIDYTFYSFNQEPGSEYKFRFIGDNGKHFVGKITLSIQEDNKEKGE